MIELSRGDHNMQWALWTFSRTAAAKPGCSRGCRPPEPPPTPRGHFDLMRLLPCTSSSCRSEVRLEGVTMRSACGEWLPEALIYSGSSVEGPSGPPPLLKAGSCSFPLLGEQLHTSPNPRFQPRMPWPAHRAQAPAPPGRVCSLPGQHCRGQGPSLRFHSYPRLLFLLLYVDVGIKL